MSTTIASGVSRTGPAAGLGGPAGVISNSGLIANGINSGGELGNSGGGGGGGSWTVASAAKLLFGRAGSLSHSIPSHTTPKPTTGLRARSPTAGALNRHSDVEPVRESVSPTSSVMSMPAELNLAHARLYPSTPNNNSTPSLVPSSPLASRRNSLDVPSHSSHSSHSNSPQFPVTGAMKTLCNRGAAIISVHLAEPVLYLSGFEASEYTDRSPAMLRGSLILKLLKPAKIKAVTLVFKGRARTEWPEGIPPRRAEFFEEKELMTHTWPFFNAQFSSSEMSHGADVARFIDSQRLSMDLSRSSMDSVSSLALSDAPSPRSATPPVGSPVSNGGNSHFGIPFGQSRSFSKEDKTATQSRGYRMFNAGEYIYNFELPLDSVLPESVECDMGSVRYELEATVERSGAFKSNLSGKTEVLLVRNPSEQNLEIHEPISISRTW